MLPGVKQGCVGTTLCRAFNDEQQNPEETCYSRGCSNEAEVRTEAYPVRKTENTLSSQQQGGG